MTNTESLGTIKATNPVLTVAPPKEDSEMNGATSKITALYCRLSQEDERAGESLSIENQELLCRGWFLPSNTYDCGSFVVNGTAVVGKEPKKPYNRSDMARQEDVTEALKAANQMEWVRRMRSIRNRAEEIVLTELVYE